MMTKDHVFTLGIEEEFQIIDPETRELRSHIEHILDGGKMIFVRQFESSDVVFARKSTNCAPKHSVPA